MSFALVVALTALAGSARAATVNPTLYVAYTINCTFTISDDSGKAVSSIAPGDYQVEIETPRDFASSYSTSANDFTACKGNVQFSLTGPGVDLETTLDDGNSTYAVFTATLEPSSTYTVVDGNQPAVARSVITTFASGTPTAPATPTASGSKAAKSTVVSGGAGAGSRTLRGSLHAVVSASGKLSLTQNGRAVSALKTGRWTFSVEDKSAKAGFSVQVLNGKPEAVTSGAFVGSRDDTLALEPGRWSFFTAGGEKTIFLVLS